METYNNIKNWDLLAKYFANECSAEEIEKLLKWRDENEENKILFNQVKQDIEIINLNKSMNKVNVDSAWEKVKNRIEEDELDLPEVKETKTRSLFPTVVKYAAAIILLVGVGFFSTKLYEKISNAGINEYASLNEQGKEVILPDGSTVILNADSKISYSKLFAENERRIKLEGEAFFDVTKNPERPFIIEVKNAEVRVLGTSFNVNASIPGHKVEVFVESGLVQLSRKKNGEEKILISPGDLGMINSDQISKAKNKDQNIIAWKTKEITFYEDSIKDVIKTLNKIYKTNIVCEDQGVLEKPYNVTFKNQDIDTILNVICNTFDLKIEKSDNKIYLVKYNS